MIKGTEDPYTTMSKPSKVIIRNEQMNKTVEGVELAFGKNLVDIDLSHSHPPNSCALVNPAGITAHGYALRPGQSCLRTPSQLIECRHIGRTAA